MVVSSSVIDPIFNFKTHIDVLKPDILAVTEDDKNAHAKQVFCYEKHFEFVVLSKDFSGTPLSTTSIISHIRNH